MANRIRVSFCLLVQKTPTKGASMSKRSKTLTLYGTLLVMLACVTTAFLIARASSESSSPGVEGKTTDTKRTPAPEPVTPTGSSSCEPAARQKIQAFESCGLNHGSNPHDRRKSTARDLHSATNRKRRNSRPSVERSRAYMERSRRNKSTFQSSDGHRTPAGRAPDI